LRVFPRVPSREVVRTAELYVPVDPRTIRFLSRRPALRVSSSSQRLSRPTVLRPFRDGFILSCPRPSSEFLRQSSRPTLQPTLTVRVSSLFAASIAGVHSHGSYPLPLRSVLRFSQPLDGFLHHRPCGPVSSRSHVQGFSVQGFLPPRSRAGSSPVVAPLPLSRVRSPYPRRKPG